MYPDLVSLLETSKHSMTLPEVSMLVDYYHRACNTPLNGASLVKSIVAMVFKLGLDTVDQRQIKEMSDEIITSLIHWISTKKKKRCP
jgi:hypothetical protein